MRGPLLLSIAVHAAALIGARPIAARLAQLAPSSEPAPPALEPDRLTGTSIEVSTSLEDTPAASQPPSGSPLPVAAAPPSDPTSPAPAPTETAPADPTAAPSTAPSTAPTPPPSAGSAPAPSASATSTSTSSATSTTSSPADKPRPRRPPRKKPRPPASSAPSASTSAVASAASAKPPASAKPAAAAASATPATSADPASSTASASPAATGTGAGSGGTFGPDGEAAKRDLGRAFTRALPFACAGDALWTKVPVGDAGTLRAVLHIDADGHVTGAEPLGDAPLKHLASLLQRTVAQLKAGIFAVRNGAVTAGTQTLEIKATVSADPGDDALAFEYESGRGKAAFIVKDGRRVDVHIRVVKVEVSN